MLIVRSTYRIYGASRGSYLDTQRFKSQRAAERAIHRFSGDDAKGKDRFKILLESARPTALRRFVRSGFPMLLGFMSTLTCMGSLVGVCSWFASR